MKIGDEKHRLSTDSLADFAMAVGKVLSGTFDTAIGAVTGMSVGIGSSMVYGLAVGPQLASESVEPAAMGGLAIGAAAGACLSIVCQARHVHSVRLLESLAEEVRERPEVMNKEIPSLRLWQQETLLGPVLVVKPIEFQGGAFFSNPQAVTFARLLDGCREHDFSCTNGLVRAELEQARNTNRATMDEIKALRSRLSDVLDAGASSKSHRKVAPR